jgi:transposase-like protein
MFRDRTHAQDWQPPHCPNPDCRFHHARPEPWRYRRHGYYQRDARPHRIRRYLCLHCRKSFSSQTFSTTYYLKRPDILPEVLALTVSAAANRQSGRKIPAAPATIDNQLARLGRHCMLLHRHLMARASPCGDIAIDGLRTFEYSKYFPFEHLVAVDPQTSLLIHWNDAPLRRMGTMTAYQERRRQQLEQRLGVPDPRAIEKGMREVLQVALRGAERATVRSDEHQAYPRAMQGLECAITHRQTSSKRKRDQNNDLCEINSLDSFWRHCSANHRRATIAWSRRRQASAERFAIFAVWKNLVKWRLEKNCDQTPAMLAGLTDHRWTIAELLAQRIFPAHVDLPPSWQRYLRQEVRTRPLRKNRLRKAARAP